MIRSFSSFQFNINVFRNFEKSGTAVLDAILSV